MPGDNAARLWVNPERIPYETLRVASEDSEEAIAIYRYPPGNEPSFPALIWLHGGLLQNNLEQLHQLAGCNPTLDRFLAAGYVTVAATFRSRQENYQNPATLWDCLAITEAVRAMAGIDPERLVVWGDSGGGSLAMELAGELPLCAIAVQEPANVLFTGFFQNDISRKVRHDRMANPREHYTDEVKAFTRAKLSRIGCPVFFASGGMHIINRINHELIIPEMLELGKPLEAVLYPGAPHGFSNGKGTPEQAKDFFEDVQAFFSRHLPTQPVPIAPDYLEHKLLTDDHEEWQTFRRMTGRVH